MKAKFSDQNKKILLVVKESKTDWMMQVTDHGVGIPKKELSKVFEGFYKGNSDREGMGLGLYLAKDVVDRHHGEIKISSKEGKGTTISLSLPKSKI